MTVSFLSLFLLTVLTRGLSSTFTCPRMMVQSLVPDPDDCRHYYHCLPDGRVFPMECPDGLVFDARQKVCIWDSNARSCAPDHDQQPAESPRRKNNAAKPTSSTRTKAPQRRNSNNAQRSRNAPPKNPNRNPQYDHPKRVSGRRSNVDLKFRGKQNSAPISGKVTNEPAPAVTMATKTVLTTDRFPRAKDNNNMPRPNTGERFQGGSGADDRNGQQTTPRGTSGIFAWGQKRHLLQKRSAEDNLIGDSVYCPTGYAYIPDPLSCSAFYHCYNWQPMRKQCPPGLFFDMQTHVCNWQHNVNCVDGNRGKAILTFNDRRKTYKNAPRGIMSVKSGGSPQKSVDGERRALSKKKKAARKATTTVSPKRTPTTTSKTTSTMKTTTTPDQLFTTKSAIKQYQPSKQKNNQALKNSSPQSKSQHGVDLTRKWMSPTPTFNPASSSSTFSSTLKTLSTSPKNVRAQHPKVADINANNFNRKSGQSGLNQTKTTTKKTVMEETSPFTKSRSNKPTARPVVLSLLSGQHTSSMLSSTTTISTLPNSKDPGSLSNSSKRNKGSHSNSKSNRSALTTTVTTVKKSNIPLGSKKDTATKSSILLGSKKDTATKSSILFGSKKDTTTAFPITKMPLPLRSQSTDGKEIMTKNIMPKAKTLNDNPTQTKTQHNQTKKMTTTINSHSLSPSSSPNTARLTSPGQDRTDSSLSFISTVVPIDAFKSVLDTVSPMTQTKLKSSEQTTAQANKNQTAPKALEMTKVPSSTVRNLRVQPITWMNRRRISTPYKSGKQADDHSNDTQLHNTSVSFSQSFFPASLSYTPSTLLFRKLVIADYSESPGDVQIEKFMANFLNDLGISKSKQFLNSTHDHSSQNSTSQNDHRSKNSTSQNDHRSKNSTSQNETRTHSVDVQTNNTDHMEEMKLQNNKSQAFSSRNVDDTQNVTTVRNRKDMNVTVKIANNTTAYTSSPTTAVTQKKIKAQNTTTANPSTPLSSTAQPVHESSGNNMTVSIDTYNVKLSDKSKEGENATSPTVQPQQSNKTSGEEASSGPENSVHHEEHNSGSAGSDGHPDHNQTHSVHADQHQLSTDPTDVNSTSNVTAVSGKPSKAEGASLQLAASESVMGDNTEDQTQDVNSRDLSKLNSTTVKYLTTLQSRNVSIKTPSPDLLDDTEPTDVTTPIEKTKLMSQQVSNCTTKECNSTQTEKTTETSLNSSRSATNKLPSKSVPTVMSTVSPKPSKTGQMINAASATGTVSNSTVIKDLSEKAQNVLSGNETAKTPQNATERGVVLQLSNNTVGEKGKKQSKPKASLFLSISHTGETLKPPQADASEDTRLSDGQDLTQKPNNKTETANLTAFQSDKLTNQSADHGQAEAKADKGMNAMSSVASSGLKSNGQSSNLTQPSVSIKDVNATSMAGTNQSAPAPEVIKKNETSQATTKTMHQTENTMKSTLVFSVEYGKKNNHTLLQAKNMSVFSNIKAAPGNETINSSASDPSPATTLTPQRAASTKGTLSNSTSVNGTVIPLQQNNSVASMAGDTQKNTVQEAKLGNDSLVHSVAEGKSNEASLKNASVSENLIHVSINTTQTNSTDKTSGRTPAESTDSSNKTSSSVIADSTELSQSVPPSPGSVNKTNTAAFSKTKTPKNSTLSTGATSKTPGVNSISSKHTKTSEKARPSEKTNTPENADSPQNPTSPGTKALTTLSADSAESEDPKPHQQSDASHADTETDTTTTRQEADNTEQSPSAKDSVNTSVESTNSNTPHNEETILSDSGNSTDGDHEESGQTLRHRATIAGDNTVSKRSFVSLKDLITWYLKHWKNYSQWQRGQ